MSPDQWPRPDTSVPENNRDRTVVQSALWAAAGDALGWITELSHGAQGVARRTGVSHVAHPIAWQRVVGGRGGPKVRLPAGTYSDDTQVRLAVSRSIRGDGFFDVEAFAKVEMTVWPSYALGAGLGSKAAAANLARRGVNWFSNFYERGSQKYVDGGGNGAAMRIQPHVWSSKMGGDILISEVLRSSIVTHGHPHGFCGAVFHALCLDDVLRRGVMPTPKDWMGYVDRFLDLPKLVAAEPQLAAFWQAGWESSSGCTLASAMSKMRDEGHRDLELVATIDGANPHECYRQALKKLGCLSRQYRGSGWKTALAALVLAYLFRDSKIEEALEVAVNELESDTDTIATMAGALLGGVSDRIPDWPLQDCGYIAKEALRVAAISRGETQESFPYPDLGHWNPPIRQYASVARSNGGMAIAGLGQLNPQGTEYSTNDTVWQWFELPFGQTILAKRKAVVKGSVASTQLPGSIQSIDRQRTREQVSRSTAQGERPAIGELFPEDRGDDEVGKSRDSRSRHDNWRRSSGTLDTWTDEVISSGFDDNVLGRMLNRCIDESMSVESAVSFASIIAKAKLARYRKRR